MPTYLISATIFRPGLRGTYTAHKKQFKVHGVTEAVARLTFQKNFGYQIDTIRELEVEPLEESTTWKEDREGFYTDLGKMRDSIQLLSEFKELTCEERNTICKINCHLSRLLASWQMRTMEIESGGILKC